MRVVEQCHWRPDTGWGFDDAEIDADWVLLFGTAGALCDASVCSALWSRYPQALCVGCSTAGEIHDVCVYDDTLVATAVKFDATELRGHQVAIPEATKSREVGEQLASALKDQDLSHILVLSDGLKVNGTELVAGLTSDLPEDVTVTGGLAGDGEGLGRTFVLYRTPDVENAEPSVAAEGVVVAVGFYGERLRVGCGSMGGWDPFGPERKITRSEGNVLYELDGQSALTLYKKFLGEKAAELPTSALLFPLSLRSPDGSSSGIVRTVLAVDEEDRSMTFAGDVGQGWYAQLMKANFERLIDGALGAAKISLGDKEEALELALLVSCVGRKLVLKQRIEEEVEAVREVLGPKPALTGFYSLGEISPFSVSERCELHNQTMTITTFREI